MRTAVLVVGLVVLASLAIGGAMFVADSFVAGVNAEATAPMSLGVAYTGGGSASLCGPPDPKCP